MSIGDDIAAEFDRDKVHLTPAEQRRLAGMIDGRIAALSAAAEAALAHFEGSNYSYDLSEVHRAESRVCNQLEAALERPASLTE